MIPLRLVQLGQRVGQRNGFGALSGCAVVLFERCDDLVQSVGPSKGRNRPLPHCGSHRAGGRSAVSRLMERAQGDFGGCHGTLFCSLTEPLQYRSQIRTGGVSGVLFCGHCGLARVVCMPILPTGVLVGGRCPDRWFQTDQQDNCQDRQPYSIHLCDPLLTRFPVSVQFVAASNSLTISAFPANSRWQRMR